MAESHRTASALCCTPNSKGMHEISFCGAVVDLLMDTMPIVQSVEAAAMLACVEKHILVLCVIVVTDR